MRFRYDRRAFLQMLVTTGLVCQARLSRAEAPPGPFVLVHGAWHGGWCWRKVRNLLVERGQHVFTPSLTGLGDRRHLAEPEIGLTSHVEDIVSLLVVEDLRKVVLVGHSYAGLVVGGVAQREPDRLRHIVFLDAFLPEPGRSLQDMVPGFEFERIARERGDGWKIPMDAVFSLEALGVHDEEDKTWMEPRLTDQPIRTFTEASSITRKTLTSVPCSYIQSSSIPTFAQAAAEARKRGWAVREMVDAGHDSMVTKPKELVEVMLAFPKPC